MKQIEIKKFKMVPWLTNLNKNEYNYWPKANEN